MGSDFGSFPESDERTPATKPATRAMIKRTSILLPINYCWASIVETEVARKRAHASIIKSPPALA